MFLNLCIGLIWVNGASCTARNYVTKPKMSFGWCFYVTLDLDLSEVKSVWDVGLYFKCSLHSSICKFSNPLFPSARYQQQVFMHAEANYYSSVMICDLPCLRLTFHTTCVWTSLVMFSLAVYVYLEQFMELLWLDPASNHDIVIIVFKLWWRQQKVGESLVFKKFFIRSIFLPF